MEFLIEKLETAYMLFLFKLRWGLVVRFLVEKETKVEENTWEETLTDVVVENVEEAPLVVYL